MVDIHKLVNEHKELVINTRRDLHRIPEVGYTEEKTSAYVADYLTREGLEVQTGIAQFGVVGLLNTGKPGPTLMVRADIDALPLQEETGLDFASTHDGVMHACGHDAHMAMGLAAATVLNKVKDEFTGTVKFIFQPAEEGPGGAEPMIKEGVMENPKVDYAIGCHVWPEIPEGTIGVRSGPFLAAMDRWDLKIIGKGGHGAMPHQCVDALEVGTQVVNALQRISSRHMSPLEPVVVTVGSFHAGTAFNIIPGEAELSGTTRTFNLDVWHSWEERLEKVIGGGNLNEIKLLVEYGGFSPMAAIEAGTRVAARVLGLENDLGTVEEGKLADLIVVAGNPLENIDILLESESVRLVMQGGKLVANDLN